MFPITDLRGRVIAFGGRALEKDVPAKYLNSPETPLFHKGDNLYNLAAARLATHNGAPLVVVEGYVDVIAMVGAGFPASVAPLGTALTENQLALLWKMADEPILCFDGDKAGQKAAWRAADLALPHLKPGKSLRFALLPEGQDPDDLARSGGRGAIEEVIGAARGLADVIWSREIEGGTLRHAGAARGAGSAHQRTHQRHPRRGGAALLPPGSGGAAAADLRAGRRARRLWPRQFPRAAAAVSAANQAAVLPPRSTVHAGRGGPNRARGGRGQASAGSQTINRGPYQAASPQLALSPIMRGQRSAISRREALILQSLINHPWLLHDHLEEVAALELAHPEAQQAARRHHRRLRQRPSPRARSRTSRPRKCAPTSQARGFSEVLQRVERAITTQAVWGAQAGAAREDVLSTWHQLVSLHRQWHSLLRELKDAELALGRRGERGQSGLAARCQGPAGGSGRHRGPDRGFWRLVGPVPAQRLIEKCMRTAAAGTAKRLAKPMVWLQKQELIEA